MSANNAVRQGCKVGAVRRWRREARWWGRGGEEAPEDAEPIQAVGGAGGGTQSHSLAPQELAAPLRERKGEEADPGNTVPVFVMRERLTGMTLAAAVPKKSTNSHIARRIVAFMREIGVAHGDLLVRTDQEPETRGSVEEAGRVRAAEGGGRYVVEQSPVGSSASNGLVERAILSVEQQARVLNSAVEDRWGVKVGARHSVVSWLVEYAAVGWEDGLRALQGTEGSDVGHRVR